MSVDTVLNLLGKNRSLRILRSAARQCLLLGGEYMLGARARTSDKFGYNTVRWLCMLICGFGLTGFAAVAFAEDPPTTAIAQGAPLTRQQCTAAHAQAFDNAQLCILTADQPGEGELRATPNWMELRAKLTEEQLRKCFDRFNAEEASIKKRCGALGEGNIAIQCEGNKNLVQYCGRLWKKWSLTCTFAEVAARCASPRHKVKMNLASIGCGHVATAAQQCAERCGGEGDEEEHACRKGCVAYEAQLLAACVPWAAPQKSASDPGSSRSKGAAATEKASQIKTGVRTDQGQSNVRRRNMLDRHDLGPTFVSPDVTTPGGRTSARGVASSKTKTKATISSDAVSPAPLPNVSAPTGGFSLSAPPPKPK